MFAHLCRWSYSSPSKRSTTSIFSVFLHIEATRPTKNTYTSARSSPEVSTILSSFEMNLQRKKYRRIFCPRGISMKIQLKIHSKPTKWNRKLSLWRRYFLLKYRWIQFKWQMESKQPHRYQNEHFSHAQNRKKKLDPSHIKWILLYKIKPGHATSPPDFGIFCFLCIKFKLMEVSIFYASFFLLRIVR